MSSHPEPSTSTDHSESRKPAPRSGASASRWRRLLRLTLVAILLLLAVRLLAGYAARAQLKQATERVAASGDSLRFSDFAPPDVDAGNNATTFLEAAGLLLDAAPAKELHQRLREIDQQRLEPTPGDLGLFRRTVESQELVLRVLDEAMRCERARYDVYYSARDPAALDIPNLVKRLKLSRLLRARAWLASDDGRPEAAWREVAKIFRLAGWLAEEMPTVIHAVIAQAVARQGLVTARDLLQTAPPAAEEMALVLAQARRWDPRVTHARVLRAERAAMTTTLLYEDGWHDLAGSIAPARLNFGPWPLDISYDAVLTSWPLRPWFDWNAAAYTEAMTRLIEGCEAPADQRPADGRGRFAERISPPRWAVLARMALPNLIGTCVKRDLLIADLDLMAIAFRLAQQHRETGSYPQTLDSLGDVAVDPFSGEPYRYRLEAGGAVVYSVAGNRTDDGGAPGTVEPAPGVTKSIPELDSGDLVWRLGPTS